MEEIFNILPQVLANKLKSIDYDITEIRLRQGKKCYAMCNGKTQIEIDYTVTLKDLMDILVKVSLNSIYAIQNEINNGFITINGGHRIGICGEAIVENNKVINIKNINSMNIRVARQILGAANGVINYVLNGNKINNTVIISPPACGKTTMLRDLIRQISDMRV